MKITIAVILLVLLIAIVILLVFAKKSYQAARQAGQNRIVAAFSAIWDLFLEFF